MGGQNETVLPKKSDTTDLGQGIRVHSSGGYVHFHDDEKSKGKDKVKVAVPSAVFWKGWNLIRDGQERQFRYVDPQNNCALLIKTNSTSDDVIVLLSPTSPYGPTFQALDKFANA